MGSNETPSPYDEQDKKKLVVLGRDMSNDPCLRNSLMYSIGTSMLVGVTYNLVTLKNPVWLAVGTYGGVLFTSWYYCKYKRYQQRKQMEVLKPLLNSYGLMSPKERAKLDEEWAASARRTNVRNFRSDAIEEKQTVE